MSALPVATTVDDPMTPVGARLVATASRLFYEAVLEVLGVPVGGGDDDFFCEDEFVVSSVDS